MNEAVVLQLESLTIRYGKKLAADSVTLSVPRGAVYALLGRNGAGKSSIIRCLLGQQRPQIGGATLFGEDSWRNRAHLMKRVGVVPEEPDAPPEMTARAIGIFCGRLDPAFEMALFARRLSRWSVPDSVSFSSLSKGQKGQVMLAAALSHRPELLVLDDPTLGLDAIARREFFDELIGELAERGVTVLVATHDLAGVEGIADRIGILRAGRLVLDEEMETVRSRFRKLRYSNDRNVESSAPGQELDPFFAQSVQVRGWGVEAVVSDFSDEAFARFCETPGVVDAEASPLTLEEVFRAVAGAEKETRS
jgi:ABC-2 type transport system ATP-binding protein